MNLAEHSPRSRSRRAFTLTETLIALSISSVIASGITSSYMFIYKSTLGAVNYVDMNNQSRRALETFSRDIRQADQITVAENQYLSVAIPTTSGNRVVVYAYDTDSKRLVRKEGGWSLTLIENVQGSISFGYSDIAGSASSNLDTIKKIQFVAVLGTHNLSVVAKTQKVISAEFIMRNKKT